MRFYNSYGQPLDVLGNPESGGDAHPAGLHGPHRVASVTTMHAIDLGDYWELPLKGEVVARCCVDQAFGLEFGVNRRSFVLRIEGKFSVASPGKRVECLPENRASLGPSLALYGETVEFCRAAKSGALDIEFAGGIRVHVEPDDRYEAWELAGEARGLRVVCGPGGALSIWQPPGLKQ